MRAAAVALSVCLLLSGCRKKSAREYYRLESDYQVLVSRDGDAAYDEPELATIVDGLNAIPTDALERPKAEALLATIAAETLRVHKDKPAPTAATPTTGNADALYQGLQQQRQDNARRAAAEAQAAAEAAAADAGVTYTEPVNGMSEAAFIKAFGTCFTRGAPLTLPDGTKTTTQQALSSPACQKWGGATWLFDGNGLLGKLVENKIPATRVEFDAGTPPPAPPPKTTRFLLGGPAGSDAPPPPSVDDKQFLNDTPPPTVTPPAQ